MVGGRGIGRTGHWCRLGVFDNLYRLFDRYGRRGTGTIEDEQYAQTWNQPSAHRSVIQARPSHRTTGSRLMKVYEANTQGLYEVVRAGSNDFTIVEAFKLGESVVEKQFLFTDRAVAMFADQNIGNAFAFRVLIVHLFAVDKHHHIGVLLN